jgi:hypothetical protein
MGKLIENRASAFTSVKTVISAEQFLPASEAKRPEVWLRKETPMKPCASVRGVIVAAVLLATLAVSERARADP